MTDFTVKDWKDATTHEGGGDTTTPISAAALEDMETRVTSSGGRTITVANAAHVPLTLKGAAAQSADLLQLKNSGGDLVGQWHENGEATFYGNAGGNTAPAGLLHKLTQIGAAGQPAAAHYFYGENGEGTGGVAWMIGLDVGSDVPGRDFVIGKANPGSTGDMFYIQHNGTDHHSSINLGGSGITASAYDPDESYAVNVIAGTSDQGEGGMSILVPNDHTGLVLASLQSATGDPMWTLNLNNEIWPLISRSDSTQAAGFRDVFLMGDPVAEGGGGGTWRFQIETGDNSLMLNYVNNDTDLVRFYGDGGMQHMGTKLGFFTSGPVTQQTLAAAATDPASTQTLANSIRDALRAYWLCA